MTKLTLALLIMFFVLIIAVGMSLVADAIIHAIRQRKRGEIS